MSAGLVDHLINRQAEASRILAACACIYPARTLELLKSFDSSLLQDSRAAAYLRNLAEIRAELDQVDQLAQVELSVRLAWNMGIERDMLKWQGHATSAGIERGLAFIDLTAETIVTIYRLVIARNEIQSLLLDSQRRAHGRH